MTEKEIFVNDSINETIEELILDYKREKQKLIERMQYNFQVQFSEDIIDEMVKNDTFRQFISEIEGNFSNLLKSKSVKSSNKIYFRQDWSVPDFIHIVLMFKLEGLSFDDELKLWGEIILYINEKITALIDQTSRKEKEELIGYERHFSALLDLE